MLITLGILKIADLVVVVVDIKLGHTQLQYCGKNNVQRNTEYSI